MTEPGLVMPSGAAAGAQAASVPSGTVVYDYGILHADEARPLHCPCGRTDSAGRAEAVIAAHLAGAPAGTRAVILIRAIAGDGTTGPAYLYALAERGANGVTWPTHLGIRAPGNDAARDARDGLAPPARAGRPPGPGSTTIARTA